MHGRGFWNSVHHHHPPPPPPHHLHHHHHHHQQLSSSLHRPESPPDYYGSVEPHGPHTGCPVHSPFRYWLDEHGVPGPSYQSYFTPPAPRIPAAAARIGHQFAPPQMPRPISRTLHRRNTQPVRIIKDAVDAHRCPLVCHDCIFIYSRQILGTKSHFQ